MMMWQLSVREHPFQPRGCNRLTTGSDTIGKDARRQVD